MSLLEFLFYGYPHAIRNRPKQVLTILVTKIRPTLCLFVAMGVGGSRECGYVS